MLANYVFTKYQDHYYLSNTDGVNPLSWSLARQINCGIYQVVGSGVLPVSISDQEITFPTDGDYQLTLSNTSDNLIISIKNYLMLQRGLITNIRVAICAANPLGCIDCGEQNLDDCVNYQGLFTQLIGYQQMIDPYGSNFQANTYNLNAFLAQAFELNKCTIATELYSQLGAEFYQGKVQSARQLLNYISGIYYLAYYFAEKQLTIDQNEQNYIDAKFYWPYVQSCFQGIGINIGQIQAIFNDVTSQNNHAPSVNDSSIIIPNVTLNVVNVYQFTTANFTLGFSDPEGDSPNMVKILQNTFVGQLFFNGALINGENFTFPISQVGSLQYKFTPTETTTGFDKIFFQISDDNPNSKFSDMATFGISVAAHVNQPPSHVGNNSISIGNRVDRVFTIADFTSNTAPAYSDPEGDPAYQVRIDTLPTLGVLLLNGVPVAAGQIIPVSQINAGLLVYDAPNQDTATSVSFNFSVSDTGSHTFVS